MSSTTTITIRVPVELVDRIKAVSDNRNAFVIEAIKEKLNPVRQEAELTDSEKRAALKGAKNLSDVMQDLILQEAARRKNFLDKMDDETFAKLVASRLPKENADNSDMEKNVLTLQACLDMLPAVEDIAAELNRVKGELFKAERERDMNLALLRHGKEQVTLAELMTEVYRGAAEYAVNMIARRNLPGFGDGGGLTDKAYADIAEEVRSALAGMRIHRSRS